MIADWLQTLKQIEATPGKTLPAALALELSPFPSNPEQMRALAVNISRFFLCLDRAHAPCLQCRGCTQTSEQRAGMDWLVLTPAPSIRLEHVHPIFERVGRAPFESHRYVVYIDSAQELTAQAANALLKLVEEPPSRWTFLFAVPDVRLLLPTLLSRCLRLRIATGEVQDALEASVLRLAEAFAENPQSAALLELAEQMAKSDATFHGVLSMLEQTLLKTEPGASSRLFALSKHATTVRNQLDTAANRKLLSHHFLLQWAVIK